MIDADNQWLPPSPHREAVLHFLSKGRAHIQERGHGVAPLLCFEDGGVMELPRARANPDRGGFFQEEAPDAATRQTRHNDICGTLDELKALMAKEPEMAAGNPQYLLRLLDDIAYMINRIRKRRERYEEFEAAVQKQLDQARAIEPPDIDAAIAKAEEIRKSIGNGPDAVADQIERLHSLAEDFRETANRAEKTLYPHRDIAKEIGRQYDGIRGGRNWDIEERTL